MKKLLLASAIAFATLSANAQETITFAMEPSYAPFETTNEKGEVIGFDVDIAKALCEELKATCEFKTQSFDSLIAGLKFKNFDAIISGMDITEARQKTGCLYQCLFRKLSKLCRNEGEIYTGNS